MPIPGIETTQTGSLRGNEQIQLEPIYYQNNPSITTYSHQLHRPIVNSEISSTQPKGFAHAMSAGGRRVAPERRYDEANG